MLDILRQIARIGIRTEAVPPGGDERVLVERLQQAVLSRMGRALAIRQVDAGSCNGCELEINALLNPVYNIEGLGIRFVASPRHADMLLVTGPVSRHMAVALQRTYDATSDPKLVVAVGDCGCTGGIFGESYASLGRVSNVIPVDVEIPGCPPTPAALLAGILTALRAGRTDARHVQALSRAPSQTLSRAALQTPPQAAPLAPSHAALQTPSHAALQTPPQAAPQTPPQAAPQAPSQAGSQAALESASPTLPQATSWTLPDAPSEPGGTDIGSNGIVAGVPDESRSHAARSTETNPASDMVPGARAPVSEAAPRPVGRIVDAPFATVHGRTADLPFEHRAANARPHEPGAQTTRKARRPPKGSGTS